jgi:hypothetical protein
MQKKKKKFSSLHNKKKKKKKEKEKACVWILYLKVISRIFMHRMHFAKNLRCLVGILEIAKCILPRMHFANSHF